MAAMDLEDDEDIWGNTVSSPGASPPQPLAAAAAVFPCGASISTQLSLNSRLHLSTAGGSSPVGAGIYAADGGRHHMDLGGGFRNAAASPAPFFSAYNLDAGAGGVAPIDAGAARRVLEDEMCLGPGAAAASTWAGAGAGGSDRRKKRMIKNRESAARSRARKQAYVRELEREVQLLQQENESLRVKYEQVTDRKPHSRALLAIHRYVLKARAFLDSAAEGVRGGGGAGEEDSAEDAVRAILRTAARRSFD
ncbi:ABSCISIC ACID-INSENSITIVE 5-like protein 5 [Panicum miliaceum]|uniref:ABSCISIC ACID-INSENSITIVE 5-like protein 5 n=1 Tax=Panicum miliaceum TaxID=4540 RepID=A0A3L6QNQ6_PANMI|nr:ABSCISIC ACID-INSENSITIVE 5-like protein 5 [Panicum miliaceum]